MIYEEDDGEMLLPLDAYRPDELIDKLSVNTLLSLVMMLTGGNANPATVQEQIQRRKTIL